MLLIIVLLSVFFSKLEMKTVIKNWIPTFKNIGDQIIKLNNHLDGNKKYKLFPGMNDFKNIFVILSEDSLSLLIK